MGRKFATIAEVAEEIRRPVGWIYKARMRGEAPPAYRVGGKLLF